MKMNLFCMSLIFLSGVCLPVLAQDKGPEEVNVLPRYVEEVERGKSEQPDLALNVYSIPGVGFANSHLNERDRSILWHNNGKLIGYERGTTGPRDAEEYFHAPVHLPNGKQIRSASAIAIDYYGGADLFTKFVRVDKMTGVGVDLAVTVISGNLPNIQTETVNVISNNVVDNNRYVYFVTGRMFHANQQLIAYDIRYE